MIKLNVFFKNNKIKKVAIMKNIIKITLLMLSIGLSTSIICMQKRQDIVNAVTRYVPKYDTSKEGAAAEMAKAWAEPLSDAERVALIYQCYTLPANEGANNDWPSRTAANVASAYTQRAKNFVSSTWKWISYEKPAEVISGVKGAIGSYVTPAFKYAASFIRTPLKRLDEFLNTNKNVYINGKNNTTWFNNVIRLAREDFNDPDVKQYLTEKQQIYATSQVDLIVDKILPVIEEAAKINNITPSTREQIRLWVERQWLTQPMQQLAPLTPLQQLAIQKDIQWQEEQKRLQQPAGWFSNWGLRGQQQQPVQPQQGQQFIPQQPQQQQFPQQPQIQQFIPQQQQQQIGQFNLNEYLNTMSPDTTIAHLGGAMQRWISDLVVQAKSAGLTKEAVESGLGQAAFNKFNPQGAAMLKSSQKETQKNIFRTNVLKYFNQIW
jgi:hypothetical protein